MPFQSTNCLHYLVHDWTLFILIPGKKGVEKQKGQASLRVLGLAFVIAPEYSSRVCSKCASKICNAVVLRRKNVTINSHQQTLLMKSTTTLDADGQISIVLWKAPVGQNSFVRAKNSSVHRELCSAVVNSPISCSVAGLAEGLKSEKESSVRIFLSRPSLLLFNQHFLGLITWLTSRAN